MLPSPEFETFLDRLGTLVRLSRPQREAIRAELADHMEAQMADLVAAGRSRDEAMDVILDEFGDAAELAGQFTQIGFRRRLIMRSAIAASLVAAVVLGTSFLMPQQPGNPLTPISLSAGAINTGVSGIPSVNVFSTAPQDQAAADALEQTIAEVKFDATELADAMRFVRDVAGINVVVRWQVLADQGIDPQTPVNLSLKDVRLSQALPLLLKSVGHGSMKLDYRIDNGILIVSTQEDLDLKTEVRMYNCAELLEASGTRWIRGEVERALLRLRGEAGSKKNAAKATESPRAGVSTQVVLDQLVATLANRRVEDLETVIAETVDPGSWRDMGGTTGQITVFDDVFVIVQTPKNHEAITRLLDSLASIRAMGESR